MPGYFVSEVALRQFIDPVTRNPRSGMRADFFEAATNTRLSVYADWGLTTPLPNPVIADAYGQFPPIYLDEDDEFYRLRLTSSSGSVLPLGDGGSFDIPIIPIIRSSSSSGGGDVTIGTSDLSTGDVIWSPKTGTKTNFVRLNGRTIGSASSGATERANADTEDLYTFYWTNFANTIAPVTGGRGISAAADFAANKPIALLDLRSRGLLGLDDMGGSALGALSSITFTKGDATTAGSSAGSVTHELTEDELPVVNLTATTTSTPSPGSFLRRQTQTGVSLGGNTSVQADTGNDGISITSVTEIDPFGGGEAHPILNPCVLGTFYQRL